jgi:hypothetical protein|tara:strand:+ start:1446 stop:1634 length:189 start_codon:yes stop_codon:yes gene_type:complete
MGEAMTLSGKNMMNMKETSNFMLPVPLFLEGYAYLSPAGGVSKVGGDGIGFGDKLFTLLIFP